MMMVFIIGVSFGIGVGLVKFFVVDGYLVIVCGCDVLCLVVFQQFSFNISVCLFDMIDRDVCCQVLIGCFVDLIIFCVGICEYFDYGQVDVVFVEWVMVINFFGLVNCLVVLQMQLEVGDWVVLVSFMVYWLFFLCVEVYGVFKVVLIWFVNSLCLDWELKGVVVMVVFLGFVDILLMCKNDFVMFGWVSVDWVVVVICYGLVKGKNYIVFFIGFSLVLWLLVSLLLGIQCLLLCRMVCL